MKYKQNENPHFVIEKHVCVSKLLYQTAKMKNYFYQKIVINPKKQVNNYNNLILPQCMVPAHWLYKI